MGLQELYEKKREAHGCKKRKSYADRAWCHICSREAMKEFYGGAKSRKTDQR